MEHEAPRQREITLESISLDVIPVDKQDIHYFLMLIAVRNVPDEEAERYLYEAIEAARLVEEFMAELRKIEKPMRRLYRAGQVWTNDDTEIADLEYAWLGMLTDAVILDDSIRRTSIGKYFPRTRHRLTRQLQYVFSTKHGRSLRNRKDESSESPAETPGETAAFHQIAETVGNFTCSASPFRMKIYNFRNSYCKK